MEIRMKKIIFAVFIMFISFNWAFGGNIIISKLPPVSKLPSPKNCASACHQVGNIYDEFSSSAHKDLECFDCHLPSKVQKMKYSKEERGFFRLGYHKQDQTWEETSGNEACQRCHVDEGMAGTSQKCWTCHMPENGKDNIVFPTQDNTKEVKEAKILPHKSHTFKVHINK